MRWADILSQSFQNLMRRKLRSTLTMLGVVIGTAAIIVTISLGYGAEQAQMDALAEQSNLRLVTVYPYYGSAGTGNKLTKITDSVITRIRSISGVTAVTPIVGIWIGATFQFVSGKYENSTYLTAVSPEDFLKIVPLKTGKGFTRSAAQMEFIMSENTMLDFRDPKKEYQYVDIWTILQEGGELPLPDIDWLSAKFTMNMIWYDYNNIDNVTGEAPSETKSFSAKFVGSIQGSATDYTFASGAYVSLDWLKKVYKENKTLFKELGLSSIDSYDTVYVLCGTVDDVERVLKAIDDMGLQRASMLDTLILMREQIRTTQGFLGFIGAISMLVAALSIANTMMMSIYERTREIGVMKVLGCRLSNIRAMFLCEAMYIGVIGGLLGLLLSYLLSYCLNNVEWLQELVASIMSNAAMFESGGKTSVIPPQLSFFTWLFVVLIALLSGFYPAQRAMRLSSLAAIRNSD